MGAAFGRFAKLIMFVVSAIAALVLISAGIGLLNVPPENEADRTTLLTMAAFPLMLGSSIIAFWVFDFWFRKESQPPAPSLGILGDLNRPATDTFFPGVGASVQLEDNHLVIRVKGPPVSSFTA
ncbi:MAG: hypothetical protein ABI898_09355 [Sphingomonadales bacterium]